MAMCMVDAGVEVSIYQKAKDLGVTFITVTEHQSLQSFHNSVLTLHGNGTWTYTTETIGNSEEEEEDEEEECYEEEDEVSE